jgi:hypothetical protein
MANYIDIKKYNTAMSIAEKHNINIFIDDESFRVSYNSETLGTCFTIDDLYSFLSGFSIAIETFEENENEDELNDEEKEFIVLDMESLTLILNNEGDTYIFKTRKLAINYCRNLISDYKIIEV